ncbi:hypothetical protein [Marinicrinis lubricantis]|uniref:Fluoroquinolone transport system permease protein n=1 Tax=Marinicrinis lubricantis TaxID=2086470 RepID=A0ABW1IQS9_9BACL
MQFIPLLLQDFRQMRRDPMLLMCIVGAFLLMIAARFVPSVLEPLLARYGEFSIDDYELLLFNLPIFLIPLLIGMVCGFMMLDDRDERIVMIYAVTPIGKSGYIWMKLLLPFAAAVMLSVTACVVIPSGSASPLILAYICLLSGIQAVLGSLFLAAFASNKVEGLAYAKGLGICIAAPLAVSLIGPPYELLLAPMPAYWVSKLIVVQGAWHQLLAAIIGGVYHVILAYWLYRKYVRKLEL